ncbi:DUF2784 domain-containing protein [Accumulibacter sp.]|uniref:DUF2784 domain-containing protein n=1 Tax=Accumulibacter sp. TaxID=2053492 RepID=UPI0025F74F2C|nr:DUF2784 domain-containing protein [Accumulibacter sp.]MCM8593818.1 DUF2784 domain-containing protein [Accumulibacter sp.]MCM8626140.1 DUF2784 domain-containing protein [Accumulibacter sp.]MDS4047959.1 DUF2784 domain-containing protein [Accumulibacter sp.]
MSYRLLADAVVVAHLLFILFVVFGGLLVLRWPRLALAHLPAACWGALIEVGGWICPLTPLENGLREAAGEAGYPGSFIARYLLPVIYPAGLTRELQFVLAAVVVAVNLAVYAELLRRWGARRSGEGR